MSSYILLGLIFSAFFLLTLLLLYVVSQRVNPTSKRLKDLENFEKTAWKRDPNAVNSVEAQKKISPKLEQIILKLGQMPQRSEKKRKTTQLTLVQAGYYQENSVAMFYFLKIILSCAIFLIYIYAGILKDGISYNYFVLTICITIMSFMLPSIILNYKARKRQGLIGDSLPDTLDLLVICVEAGMSLNSALIRVGEDIRLRCKAMSDELFMLNKEMRTGVSREQALRNLSNRSRVEDLKILVGSMVLADRLGTSIADTLRSHSDSLRVRVRQKAEERAAKASIKMLFPLIFCILPALYIVILGPALIQIFESFAFVSGP